MINVVHCKRAPFDTYIGRAHGDMPASKWGNPFVIGKDGTRDEVIQQYESWIKTQPDLMAALPELRGKTLGCWCKPDNACHGDVLARLAETAAPTSILGLFSSHYSYVESVLTLEEAGKTKIGNPVSIVDLAKTHALKQVVLVDTKIDGFIEAYKNIQKAGISQLVYGVKMCVCADETDKSDESLKTESNIIVFVKNTQGYSDLIKIYNRAWTTNFYHQGRTSWRQLKDLWTPNLALSLPFFSSMVAKNLLTFSSIVPDFPVPPTVFLETDSGLPFVPLIESAALKFAADNGLETQATKSIYYEDGQRDFDSYVTFRAIGNRSEFARPNVDHLCSNKFSFSEWKRLSGGAS